MNVAIWIGVLNALVLLCMILVKIQDKGLKETLNDEFGSENDSKS